MSIKKVVDKTNEVLKKQQELNGIIRELRYEVSKLKFEYEEGILTPKKVEVPLSPQTPIQKPEPVKESEPVTNMNISKDYSEYKPKQENKPPINEMPKETIMDGSAFLSEEAKERIEKRKATRRNVIEFFLGKNIIAKIAIVLIFLGVVSFGQLAYVDFLNNTERFFFILGIGLVSGGLGYFFERRNGIVFSNVFYGMSIFILYLSFLLGRFEYGIMDNLSYLISAIGLTLVVYLYFVRKRYEFLDAVVMIFYFTILLTQYVVFRDETISVAIGILMALLTAGIGAITYQYFIKLIDHQAKLKYPLFTLLSTGLFVFAIVIMTNTDSSLLLPVLFACFFIYFIYLFNIKNSVVEGQGYKFMVATSTVLVLFTSSFAIGLEFVQQNIMDNESLMMLFVTLTFIPLYVVLYFKNKRRETGLMNVYLLFSIVMMVIFTLALRTKNPNFSNYIFMKPYLRNIILLSEILVLYIISKLSDSKAHKIGFYILLSVSALFSVRYFIESLTLVWSDLGMVASNAVFLIGLYGINYLFMRYREKDYKDIVLINLTSVIYLIPFVILLSRMWIKIDYSITMTSVIVFVIGFRWLMELDFFKAKQYQTEFILFLNSLILILTFTVNFQYFDHNFYLISEVAKFTYVMLVNIYIIQSLIEVYKYLKDRANNEQLFILLYILGVIIQSIFIHRYLNIEFDKVILSSYFMIASAVSILFGFKQSWKFVRILGLSAIYFSLLKFFIYDFYSQNLTTYVRMGTYFIMGFVLLGISFLYAYLERTYGTQQDESTIHKTKIT